jgi:hypothetical protein
MIRTAGADPNAKGNYGSPPLMGAVREPRLAILAALLENGIVTMYHMPGYGMCAPILRIVKSLVIDEACAIMFRIIHTNLQAQT